MANCTVSCIAKFLDITYDNIIISLGHDGSKGVHPQEILDILFTAGYVIVTLEKESFVQDAEGYVKKVYSNEESERRFSSMLRQYPCFLYLSENRAVPHMVLWDPYDGTSWDPNTDSIIAGVPKQTTIAFIIVPITDNQII